MQDQLSLGLLVQIVKIVVIVEWFGGTVVLFAESVLKIKYSKVYRTSESFLCPTGSFLPIREELKL